MATKKRFFTADLHIHSCLSPCAELDMTPKRIIQRALAGGLDIIAIADHNSCENLEPALRLAGKMGITLLAAMEVASAEEVHVLALFDSLQAALGMQEKVYASLPADLENDPAFWGEQVVVNEAEEVLGFNSRLLAGATGMPLNALVEAIHALGGLAIASHVDRESFSVISQLGFIPPGVRFDALEVSGGKGVPPCVEEAGLAAVSSSDAHRLEDVGKKKTRFLLDGASFSEIASALKSEGGRSVVID
ncbi:MAG: PHP domain-containing protein [Nitrospiraceae bacterium]|nr:PHP domain-containing protein [Nitrospiraceae bacterium]